MTATTKFEGDDLRKVDPKFQPPRFGHYLAAVNELKALAHDRFGKSVLAARGSMGPRPGPEDRALERTPLDPVSEIDGWHIDDATKL
jgi:hypothetical protein